MKIRYITADGFEIEEEVNVLSPEYSLTPRRRIERTLNFPLRVFPEGENGAYRSRVYDYWKREKDVIVYREVDR